MLKSFPFQNSLVLLNEMGLGSENMNLAINSHVPLKHNQLLCSIWVILGCLFA